METYWQVPDSTPSLSISDNMTSCEMPGCDIIGCGYVWWKLSVKLSKYSTEDWVIWMLFLLPNSPGRAMLAGPGVENSAAMGPRLLWGVMSNTCLDLLATILSLSQLSHLGWLAGWLVWLGWAVSSDWAELSCTLHPVACLPHSKTDVCNHRELVSSPAHAVSQHKLRYRLGEFLLLEIQIITEILNLLMKVSSQALG